MYYVLGRGGHQSAAKMGFNTPKGQLEEGTLPGKIHQAISRFFSQVSITNKIIQQKQYQRHPLLISWF